MLASLFGQFAFQLKVAMNTYYGTYALGDFGYVTYLSANAAGGYAHRSFIAPVLVIS